MDYGRAIRTIRASRRLTQSELATRLGVQASYLSLLEAKKRKPSAEFLESLAHRLRIPAYLILFLASEKQDLRGIPEAESALLGKQILSILRPTA